jgi:nicotinamidase-related amidase
MYFSLLLFSTFTILLTFGKPSDYEQLNKKLINISEQLDRVELQLNNSVKHLLNKIDENNHDVIQSIKSLLSSRTNLVNNQSASRPVSALLIIDVQNDFINGSLALRNGEEVVPVINHLLNSSDFDVVVYSYDWHPFNHISFYDNLPLRSNLLTNDSIPLNNLRTYSTATFSINGIPRMEQILWPRHCVQNTTGAQLHSDLKIIDENDNPNTTIVHLYKGTKPNIDSYSAFWDNFKLSETKLNQQFKDKNVTQVFVVGLATDYCVYSTAIHAMDHGYKTFIVEDACRGVTEKTTKERLHDFTQKNGHLIQSNQVKDYLG